jgi:hypothetical protein
MKTSQCSSWSACGHPLDGHDRVVVALVHATAHQSILSMLILSQTDSGLMQAIHEILCSVTPVQLDPHCCLHLPIHQIHCTTSRLKSPSMQSESVTRQVREYNFALFHGSYVPKNAPRVTLDGLENFVLKKLPLLLANLTVDGIPV